MIIENRYKEGSLKALIRNKLFPLSPALHEKYIQFATSLKDRSLESKIRKHIDYLYSFEIFPLFNHIYIETINRCNGGCSFCNINRFRDPREFKKMDYELFISIINQLKEMEYKGMISFHSNNEPLLDKRVYEFVKIARENLPLAKLTIWTNGTILNLDRFIELMKYLDLLVIDNYNDNLELHKNVREIFEYCNDNGLYENKVRFIIRKETEKLRNRASSTPNRGKIKTLKSLCLYPFRQIVVRPDGKISLCCNDGLGAVTRGDLLQQSLIDIWYGEKGREIRKRISQGRHTINICAGCDILHYPPPDILANIFHPPSHLSAKIKYHQLNKNMAH